MQGFSLRPVISGVLFLLLSLVSIQVGAEAGEWELKAAYTLNFAKFTHWATPAISDDAGTLRVCTVGTSPIVAAFEEAEGSLIAGRTLDVRQVQIPGRVDGCHLLYIVRLEPHRLKRTLAALSSLPILTVSDMDGFVRKGGMIGLLRQDRRLRFEIDLAAVRRAGS